MGDAIVRTTIAGKTTGGRPFSHQVAHDLLRNKIYIGQIAYQEENFKGLHEAIVDEALFEKVQKRLDQSARDLFATYEDSPLLLLGLTKCGFCESQLSTYFPGRKKSGQSYYYYQCTTNSKPGLHKCQSRNLPARELERFTERIVLHTTKDKGFFEAVVRQVKGNALESLAEKTRERNAVAVNRVSIRKQLDTLNSNLTLAIVDIPKAAAVKANVEELTQRVRELDNTMQELDRTIELLQNQQIDRAQLRKVFDEFDEMYAESTIDVKRRLLNAVIEEVRCTVRRGEKTGEIEFRLRGDGSIKLKWEEAKKANGESGKPPSGSSTPHVAWLPETHENSNYILLRIPIEISISARGEKGTAIAEGPLHCSLPLSPAAITRLQDAHLIRLPRPIKPKRLPIDYTALQQTYRRMLAEGGFASQTELARHLGVSRVWVSRVLKGIKRKGG